MCSRSPPVARHSDVGNSRSAPPWARSRGILFADRAREAAFLYGGGLLLAALAGASLLLVARSTWPVGLEPMARFGLAGAALALALAPLLLLVLTARARGQAPDLRGALAGGSATASRKERRAHGAPVVAEIALALVLCCTSALLLRFGQRSPGDAGFSSAGLVTVELNAAGATARERAVAWATVLERVRALPGIQAESLSSPGTWVGLGVNDRVLVECGNCARGGMFLPVQGAFVTHHAVSAGYFEALHIGLVSGRTFRSSDNFDTAKVAVVNETFAKRSFEAGNPIGHRVRVGDAHSEWYTVVGVVRDLPARGLGAPRSDEAVLYLSVVQQPPATVGLAVRSDDDPAVVADRVRPVAGVAHATVQNPSTMTTQMEKAVAPLRWFGAAFALMAAAAAALALHGVLATVRAQVRARRRELALRAAVGATPLRLLALVMSRTTRTVLIGVALGSIGAWSAGRALRMRIGGMPTLDAHTALPILLAIVGAALAGALFPAWHVARTLPARTLHQT